MKLDTDNDGDQLGRADYPLTIDTNALAVITWYMVIGEGPRAVARLHNECIAAASAITVSPPVLVLVHEAGTAPHHPNVEGIRLIDLLCLGDIALIACDLSDALPSESGTVRSALFDRVATVARTCLRPAG